MIRKRYRILHWVFVVACVLFAAGINFFHTDGFFDNDPLCPACIFQSSLIEPADLFLYPVPTQVIQYVVPIAAVISYDDTQLVVDPARGPPIF